MITEIGGTIGSVSVAAADRVVDAWILGALLMQFSEDNGLVRLPSDPTTSDGWLAHMTLRYRAFGEVSPALGQVTETIDLRLLTERAARLLAEFWLRRDQDGNPVHDLTDPDLDTGFLGNVYERLPEERRRDRALVRTPAFVADFILGMTLDPAIGHFGHEVVHVIDPVCGSGTFLIEAFTRLYDAWRRDGSEISVDAMVGHTLSAIHGIDLDPGAVAITRFRLLTMALRVSGAKTIQEAVCKSWLLDIRQGDSLIDDPTGGFHVVVGNPPYVVPVDRGADQRYRQRYDAVVGKYPLTVPYMQRFFQFARPDGWVGQLTSNSFMRREFGRRLIEDFLARQATLTHILDSSGAYLPGHGTPTVILVGRNRRPTPGDQVLMVSGARGEPALPKEPALGVVWRSLVRHAGHPGSRDEWTSSRYVSYAQIAKFPWSTGTEGASALVAMLSEAPARLSDHVVRIGYFANSGSDAIFAAPRPSFARLGCPLDRSLPVTVTGSGVRDWVVTPDRHAFFPYDAERRLLPIDAFPEHQQRLWRFRTVLANRPLFGGRSFAQSGRPWHSWHHVAGRAGDQQAMILYSWVSTHNHFVAVPDGVVPLHSAPVIELGFDVSSGFRTDLVALLNSSVVCFWLKQVCNSKGRPDSGQTGSGEAWDAFYEFAAGRLRNLPLPADPHTPQAAEMAQLADVVLNASPATILAQHSPTRELLDRAHERWEEARSRLVAIQEELDWQTYAHYGLLPDSLVAFSTEVPPIRFGERAFEILMARRMANGRLDTTWFSRHRAAPVTDLPAHWPEAYREAVQRRMNLIKRDPHIAVLERPEFKRRWSSPTWDEMVNESLRAWLLDRCESPDLWYDERDGTRQPRPLAMDALAEILSVDPSVHEAAELYAPASGLPKVLRVLLADEHVPCVAALRYRDSALAKWSTWQEVWRRQRAEDDLQTALNDHPEDLVPPRYTSGDFIRYSYWQHRGKYDVPNERFISFPQIPGVSGIPIIGWAGWTPAERAQVLIDLVARSTADKADPVPLLVGLQEILPWTKQRRDTREHDRLRYVLDEWRRRLNLTEQALVNWRPAPPRRGRPRKAS